MNGEFPTNHGFKYNDDYDEWQKVCGNGMLILWEKPNTIGIWELSFLDSEDYLDSLAMGDEDYIITQFIPCDRDKKLDQILGQNKQS